MPRAASGVSGLLQTLNARPLQRDASDDLLFQAHDGRPGRPTLHWGEPRLPTALLQPRRPRAPKRRRRWLMIVGIVAAGVTSATIAAYVGSSSNDQPTGQAVTAPTRVEVAAAALTPEATRAAPPAPATEVSPAPQPTIATPPITLTPTITALAAAPPTQTAAPAPTATPPARHPHRRVARATAKRPPASHATKTARTAAAPPPPAPADPPAPTKPARTRAQADDTEDPL
jgi:hypothetical protein